MKYMYAYWVDRFGKHYARIDVVENVIEVLGIDSEGVVYEIFKCDEVVYSDNAIKCVVEDDGDRYVDYYIPKQAIVNDVPSYVKDAFIRNNRLVREETHG